MFPATGFVACADQDRPFGVFLSDGFLAWLAQLGLLESRKRSALPRRQPKGLQLRCSVGTGVAGPKLCAAPHLEKASENRRLTTGILGHTITPVPPMHVSTASTVRVWGSSPGESFSRRGARLATVEGADDRPDFGANSWQVQQAQVKAGT
ncbi:uncharacterized protein B0I36DRAFT_410876 [Microdochium trichocladiopsis]|uniref:Uncharacterized protein n=1 Tax=Microdochium trichocladiopsis TaxID=1682393 RepID=A0A9P8Y2B2_9PEZI|nr:uncharacterized protein B0I36DRAFT_410876 [Microdochium trichocladiopsis]KAH7029144.1 hypothetical protein B0I36DRAFT_410876 [Microdochium trichocladiopsis]